MIQCLWIRDSGIEILNLHRLKAVAIKEVTHLTMILILNKDHTPYSDAFRNIFKGGALCKKCFPDGLSGIKMRKGGAAQAIVCHFCPHACSNDDYAYHHLAAIHLNIQWGCWDMFWVHQWIPVKDQETHSVPPQKELLGTESCLSHKKDEGSKSDSSLDGISS